MQPKRIPAALAAIVISATMLGGCAHFSHQQTGPVYGYQTDRPGHHDIVQVYDLNGKTVLEEENITQDKVMTFKAKKGKKYFITVEGEIPFAPLGLIYGIYVK